jgi:hypothetical protein
VSWLYGQTWLWYLIAFVVGLLLARLVLVRPQERRLKSLLLRSAAANRTSRATEAGAAGTGGAAAASTPVTPYGQGATTERLPRPVVDPAGAAPAASIPASASSVDDPTDVFPVVDPALSTLDATLVVAEAETPPSGLAVVPPPDDTATPPDGIPAAHGARRGADLVPDEPVPDEPAADEPVADEPIADEATADQAEHDSVTPEAGSTEAGSTEAGSTEAGSTEGVATEDVDAAPTTARLRRVQPSSDQPAVGEAPEAP